MTTTPATCDSCGEDRGVMTVIIDSAPLLLCRPCKKLLTG